MNFAFGCARKLYDRNIHPRVLFGPEELEDIRQTIRKGDGKLLMNAIREKTKLDIARLLSDEGVETSVERAKVNTDGSMAWNLFDIAMVGVLDENDDAVRAAKRGLASLQIAYSKPHWANSYSMMYGCSSLAYDVLFDQLTAQERSSYAKWVVESCIRPSLESVLPSFLKVCGSNIAICYSVPAMLGALTIKGDAGVPDLKPEMEALRGVLQAAVHGFLGTDGYPHEDVGYGTAVAGGVSHVVEAARRAGIYDAYADCARYKNYGNAVLAFVQPGGKYLTNTGDHSDCFICRELLLTRLAQETQSPQLLWLLGTLQYPTAKPKIRPQGEAFMEVELSRKGVHLPSTTLSLLVVNELKNAVHPAQAKHATRFHAKDRGLISLRDSWRDDATFVTFDASQRSAAAQGHFHASAGHFSLNALGEYFAIWSGRYNMEQNCHNVALVDGQSGRPTKGEWAYSKYHGVLTEYAPGDFVDFASVDSAHQHNCIWARRAFGFVRGEQKWGARTYAWTVDDLNKADDWADFVWQLHTSPENVISIHEKSATITGWKFGHKMDVHFAIPNPTDFPKAHTIALDQDIAKHSSQTYLPGHPKGAIDRLDRPAEMLHAAVYERPRLLAKVSGYNGRFMSILLPRHKSEKPVKVERMPSLMNSLAVRLTFSKVTDTLIWSFEHGMLESDDISARGQWCVIRRARKGGRVLRVAGGGLTSVKVGGKSIRFD